MALQVPHTRRLLLTSRGVRQFEHAPQCAVDNFLATVHHWAVSPLGAIGPKVSPCSTWNLVGWQEGWCARDRSVEAHSKTLRTATHTATKCATEAPTRQIQLAEITNTTKVRRHGRSLHLVRMGYSSNGFVSYVRLFHGLHRIPGRS